MEIPDIEELSFDCVEDIDYRQPRGLDKSNHDHWPHRSQKACALHIKLLTRLAKIDVLILDDWGLSKLMAVSFHYRDQPVAAGQMARHYR